MHIMQIVTIFINIFVRAALLGVVLMTGWNYGVVKFFTEAPQVGLIESFAVLFAFQTLAVFVLRPMRTETVPIYIPLKAEHFPKDDE